MLPYTVHCLGDIVCKKILHMYPCFGSGSYIGAPFDRLLDLDPYKGQNQLKLRNYRSPSKQVQH
jgi:hypothetical protein